MDHALIYHKGDKSYYDSSYGVSYGDDPTQAAQIMFPIVEGYRDSIGSTWHTVNDPRVLLFEYGN